MQSPGPETAPQRQAAKQAWDRMLVLLRAGDHEALKTLLDRMTSRILINNANDTTPKALNDSVDMKLFRDLAEKNNFQKEFRKLPKENQAALKQLFLEQGNIAKMLYTAAMGDNNVEVKQKEIEVKVIVQKPRSKPPKVSTESKWSRLAGQFKGKLAQAGVPEDVTEVLQGIKNNDLRNFLLGEYKKMKNNKEFLPEANDIKPFVDNINSGMSHAEFCKTIKVDDDPTDPQFSGNPFHSKPFQMESEPADNLFSGLIDNKKLYDKALGEIKSTIDVSRSDSESSASSSPSVTPRHK